MLLKRDRRVPVIQAFDKGRYMKELRELHKELITLFAYYAELEGAVNTWHETLKSRVPNAITSNSSLHIGRDDPNDADAKFLYAKPFRIAIQDSAKDGSHVTTHRKAVIALTYAVWEDEYRARIAAACGYMNKNDIKSDIFHDLNIYRQAILHVNSRLDRETTVLDFFNKGESVSFTEDQMTELFSTLVKELNRIGEEYYKSDPGFSFEQALNQASRPQFL